MWSISTLSDSADAGAHAKLCPGETAVCVHVVPSPASASLAALLEYYQIFPVGIPSNPSLTAVFGIMHRQYSDAASSLDMSYTVA